MTSKKVRVQATHFPDGGFDIHQYITLTMYLNKDNYLDINKDIVGFAYEWSDSKDEFFKYKFKLNSLKDGLVEIKWNEDSSCSTFDFLNTPIEKGATFSRVDNNGASVYKFGEVKGMSIMSFIPNIRRKYQFIDDTIKIIQGLYTLLFLSAIVSFVSAIVTKFLWNWGGAQLFNLPEISLLTAWLVSMFLVFFIWLYIIVKD